MPFLWDNLKKEHKIKTRVPECFTWLFSFFDFGALNAGIFEPDWGKWRGDHSSHCYICGYYLWVCHLKALRIRGSHLVCYTTISRSNTTATIQLQQQITSMGEIWRAECYKWQAFMLQSNKSSPANFLSWKKGIKRKKQWASGLKNWRSKRQ